MKIDLQCYTKKTKKSNGINRNADVSIFSNYMKDLDIKGIVNSNLSNHNCEKLKEISLKA